MAKKEIKYMIWDVEEVMSVCSQEERMFLSLLVRRLHEKRVEEDRPTLNRFIVVNEHEPYFETVVGFVDLMKKQHGGEN
jgi:hypothetical protein